MKGFYEFHSPTCRTMHSVSLFVVFLLTHSYFEQFLEEERNNCIICSKNEELQLKFVTKFLKPTHSELFKII